MGQIALLYLFFNAYVLVALPIDKNDNRRHIHVFPRLKGARKKHSVAKVWLEKEGEKLIEIAESSLTSKENELLLKIIDVNWEYINRQITKSFEGKKTILKEIKLKKG